MNALRDELRAALESDESCDLDALIEQRRPEDFEALKGLLSREPTVPALHRARAIYALGRWGDRSAIGPIRDLLPDVDEAERIGALDALGRLGGEEALEDIIRYLDSDSFAIRKFVARALGRINTPKARTALREIERTDRSDYLRSLAASQLPPA